MSNGKRNGAGGTERRRINTFAALERQQMSELGQKRPILAQLGQNSVKRLAAQRSTITWALHQVSQQWARGCSARVARVQPVIATRNVMACNNPPAPAAGLFSTNKYNSLIGKLLP